MRRLLVAALALTALLVTAQSAAALGVDWAMPNRLSAAVEDSWASNPYGLPTASFVDPASWKVELFLTDAAGKPDCPNVNRHFIWTVSGEGITENPGRPPTGPGSGSGVNCRPTATVPKLGVYHVTATEYTNELNSKGEYIATGNVYRNERVIVRDWLIVGLGDSNASGEGNPIEEAGAQTWQYAQCDRSLRAYQNLVADYVGRIDTHTSVTFVPAGCSGAKIENLFSSPYEGIQPKLGSPLPPQITQVRSVIGSRRPDAVIVSIGINDIAFSPLLKYCITQEVFLPDKPCQTQNVDPDRSPGGEITGYSSGGGATLEAQTASALHTLPRLYRAMSARLASLQPAHVFITQYPNIATEERGTTCDPDVGPLPHFFSSTWRWLDRTGAALNAQVLATSSLGWIPVTGIPEAFVGHGYCSRDSWFLGLQHALRIGDMAGAFHAILPGQIASARATVPRVCSELYGNPKCHGIAPVP